MKIRINTDELYPYYFIDNEEKLNPEIELSKEEYKFFITSMENFHKAQKMIEEKLK